MRIRTSVYYSDGSGHEHKDIDIEEGRIAAIGNMRNPDVDLSGLLVLPGFIDIHVHGGNGSDVMDGSYEAINNISLHKLKEGVTSFCPTTVTARPARTYAAIDAINQSIIRGVEGARALGAFLEGPYINPKYKGAHPEEYIRDISLNEIEDLLERGQGNIISIAIAPELPHALEAIKMLGKRNVNVRLGHSGATYEETIAGIKAGGRVAIHTYNAMSPFFHRMPGMTGAVMENDDIISEIICDFVHTHPAAARLLYKAKGADKVILITDCMQAGGMPDGNYQLGELRVAVKDGTARTDTGAIAGSTLNLLKAVKNMRQTLGVPLAEVVKMAAATPARALGIFDRFGDIAVGKYADIIALDEELNLRFVMVEGTVMPIQP
ncbi:MAG: N-acetylglucosamine-6-phosphate deacetylase [Clostridiales bacterium]|jgi:N-acetylglucosamine-6-phosphate deacetylase|nr:N-acetylglucosamine-6-phosphate deacetylase [Clostridiales bacterium]